jgi:hypothetical protein
MKGLTRRGRQEDGRGAPPPDAPEEERIACQLGVTVEQVWAVWNFFHEIGELREKVKDPDAFDDWLDAESLFWLDQTQMVKRVEAGIDQLKPKALHALGRFLLREYPELTRQFTNAENPAKPARAKPGRKPIGDRAMTTAERMRRMRALRNVTKNSGALIVNSDKDG